MISPELLSRLQDLEVVRDSYSNFLFTMRRTSHSESTKMYEWYSSIIRKLEKLVKSRMALDKIKSS